MKKVQLIMLIGIASAHATAIRAQSAPVAAGGDASGSGGSVSYSIGQVDYLHLSGEGGQVNQGNQQPVEIIVETGLEETGIDLLARVYPNPSRETLTLEISNGDFGNMRYALVDLTGKEIRSGSIGKSSTQIDIDDLAQAAYVLQVYRNQSPVKSFRILKTY